jgi:hypothetical protein
LQIFIERMASSNLVQMFLCLIISVAAYFLLSKKTISTISIFVFFTILFSFMLDLGEVYSYSAIYKRAFWYFGDDFTTWLSPFFFYAIFRRRHVLSGCVAGAAFMSGGRIGLLMLVIQCFIVIFLYRRVIVGVSGSTIGSMVAGVAIYASVLSISPGAMDTGNNFAQWITGDRYFQLFEPTKLGYGDCRTDSCFDKKLKRPFRMRTFSAIGGLWMTLEGGFPGTQYPNTPEKFADLMVKANPWGINDRYSISRDEWIKIGTVQTPYLGFGAGYGLTLMLMVMGFIGVICIAGLWLLLKRPPDPFSGFTIFFIVNATVNQTQAWLLPGPVLFTMGLCGTHIVWQSWKALPHASRPALPSAWIGSKATHRPINAPTD